MRIPPRSLIVLVGASGAGKSTWAAANFRAEQIVSSDALRALVGTAEHDQRAGTDAFDVLDTVLERRARRGLLTVVDTLGLDAARRRQLVTLARQHGMRCHAVLFDTPAETCKARNRNRALPVPAKVLSGQLAAMADARSEIEHEGFDGVHPPEPVEVVAAAVAGAGQPGPVHGLRFGLQLSSFAWGPGSLAPRLAEVAEVAEAVGFESIWLMDHLMQIPQVGRPWEDIPESWTALAWLAARTRRVRLGTLVTSVTLRPPAQLAKIVATVDVLSGGRAVCGLGIGWWEHEHKTLGLPFPSVEERYARLEDALELLPLMWGPGSPAFTGRTVSVPEAVCYPRPLQERVPLLVGGSGERRTLRLVARHADACNLFGDPETVRRKVAALGEHCRSFDRDPRSVEISHLSTALTARTTRELDAAIDRLRPAGAPPEALVDALGAATVPGQIDRYAALAEAGVQTAIVALPAAAAPGTIEAFGDVIAAFRT